VTALGETLYLDYHGKVSAYVRGKIANPHEAEEAEIHAVAPSDVVLRLFFLFIQGFFSLLRGVFFQNTQKL